MTNHEDEHEQSTWDSRRQHSNSADVQKPSGDKGDHLHLINNLETKLLGRRTKSAGCTVVPRIPEASCLTPAAKSSDTGSAPEADRL